MKFSKASIPALLTVIFTLSAENAFAFKGQNRVKEAKFTLEQARTIALKARPGKVTDEELEKEKGGSGLRYSFDIVDGKITYEVGVDAADGTVLENAPEGANPD